MQEIATSIFEISKNLEILSLEVGRIRQEIEKVAGIVTEDHEKLLIMEGSRAASASLVTWVSRNGLVLASILMGLGVIMYEFKKMAP